MDCTLSYISLDFHSGLKTILTPQKASCNKIPQEIPGKDHRQGEYDGCHYHRIGGQFTKQQLRPVDYEQKPKKHLYYRKEPDHCTPYLFAGRNPGNEIAGKFQKCIKKQCKKENLQIYHTNSLFNNYNNSMDLSLRTIWGTSIGFNENIPGNFSVRIPR
ncbi:hypothetical protein SDC9_109729 [bioreactor metagenome]|uniref:Uncharacterized protein n=1 Tax=bioreactor metagenome TaxID=1076179 RepID=A0A645BDY3_9ZZZZ